MAKKTGRPTKYTKELGKNICKRIALGETVLSIGRDPKMPTTSTIYLWLLDEDKKEFSDNYAIARMAQANHLFDETLEIADDGSNDFIEKEYENGRIEEIPDHEHLNRSRLRVDTRKWYLSKVLPKIYGDKLDLTSGNKPIQSNAIAFVPMKSDEADSK